VQTAAYTKIGTPKPKTATRVKFFLRQNVKTVNMHSQPLRRGRSSDREIACKAGSRETRAEGQSSRHLFHLNAMSMFSL
jgi:hypothetical protein